MLDQYFTEEFLRNLPADSDDAVLAVSKEWNRFAKGKSGQLFDEWVKCELIIMVRQFLQARGISIPEKLRDMDLDSVDLDYVGSVLQQEAENAEAAKAKKAQLEFANAQASKYRDLFSSGDVYEFSDEEHARVQLLVGELKSEINRADRLSAGHRERLLKRLQATESELHKRTSEIDRFYGFVGEAGIVARKYGADAKSITDRVNELAEVVLRLIVRTEKIKALPALTNLLDSA